MAMASGVFGLTLRDILDASQMAVHVGSDSFVMTLHTDTMTPDFNAWDFYADLTNELATAGGYTQNAKTMANVAVAAAAGFMTFDADDTAWTSATFSSVRGRVVNDTTIASDPLIVATTFGADYSVTAGTFTVQESANGIWRVDYIP